MSDLHQKLRTQENGQKTQIEKQRWQKYTLLTKRQQQKAIRTGGKEDADLRAV